jgi:hypothetical protein
LSTPVSCSLLPSRSYSLALGFISVWLGHMHRFFIPPSQLFPQLDIMLFSTVIMRYCENHWLEYVICLIEYSTGEMLVLFEYLTVR